MEQVLYEVCFEVPFTYFIPLILAGVFLLFPKIWVAINSWNGNETQNIEINIKKVKTFAFCLAIFAIALFFVSFIINLYETNIVISEYENGKYNIVEGKVENLRPMAYGGHGNESFDIDGIEFSYSDYAPKTGYYQSKSHGGVITHEGQNLKIGYVPINNGNRIVYIAEISDNESKMEYSPKK